MKRVQPRAQGRAYRILKRTSHITIIVQEVEPKPRKPKKPTGSRAQAARAAKQAPTPRTRTAPAETEEAAPIVTLPVAEQEVTQSPKATEETTKTAHVSQETSVVGQEPQVANVDDKTDEIGAPIENGTDAERA